MDGACGMEFGGGLGMGSGGEERKAEESSGEGRNHCVFVGA